MFTVNITHWKIRAKNNLVLGIYEIPSQFEETNEYNNNNKPTEQLIYKPKISLVITVINRLTKTFPSKNARAKEICQQRANKTDKRTKKHTFQMDTHK